MIYRVLVTTSGIGNRLGDITTYTNKSLVRVGDKPAISYIIESYPEETEFVVTVGHFADHIKQFLKLAYPKRSFTFVQVQNYSGPGSSLAYSILHAKDELQCPFIFHACDTIVKNSIPEPTTNWLGGSSKDKASDHYVSFDVNDNLIVKIRDKGEFGGDYNYIGLAGINDYSKFFNHLQFKYTHNFNDSSLSDVSSIKQMLSDSIFEYKEFEWYDIGNVESLQKTRKDLSSTLNVLDKNDEAIFIINNNIIKFFYNSTIVNNRVKRATSHLKGLVPEITGFTSNFYQYKFVNGKVLADCITEHVFKDYLQWAKNNLWEKQELHGDFRQACFDFYFTKTKKRLEQFLEQSGIKDEECEINGISVPSVADMLAKINIDTLCSGEPYRFHGDFILDNTIKTKDGFKLVDWRQDFGGHIEAGDIYYDFAKLNHNLVFNHDIVSKNLFKISSKIKCDILRSNILVECQKALFEFIEQNGFDVKKVGILTAIIWINMAPLHSHPLDIFLYYFGRYHLFKELIQEGQ